MREIERKDSGEVNSTGGERGENIDTALDKDERDKYTKRASKVENGNSEREREHGIEREHKGER